MVNEILAECSEIKNFFLENTGSSFLQKPLGSATQSSPSTRKGKGSTALSNAKVSAIVKALLTRKEAEYLMMGPPKGVPDQYWVCCLGPCHESQVSQSVEVFQLEIFRYLNLGFTEESLKVKERVEGLLTFFSKHSEILSSKPTYGKTAYTPSVLIPVRLLPVSIQSKIRTIYPGFKRIAENLFVCPQHLSGFEKPRKNSNKSVFFSFHILMSQLAFPSDDRDKLVISASPHENASLFLSDLFHYWESQKRVTSCFEARPFEKFDKNLAVHGIRTAFPCLEESQAPFWRYDNGQLIFSAQKGGDPISVKRSNGKSWILPPNKGNLLEIKTVLLARMKRMMHNYQILEQWLNERGIYLGGLPACEQFIFYLSFHNLFSTGASTEEFPLLHDLINHSPVSTVASKISMLDFEMFGQDHPHLFQVSDFFEEDLSEIQEKRRRKREQKYRKRLLSRQSLPMRGAMTATSITQNR